MLTKFRDVFGNGTERALIPVAVFAIVGILAPWIAPYDPNAQNLLSAHQGPTLAHWLGTDHLGRDTFSRLIVAARTSLIGITAVLGSAVAVGVIIGALAGYLRGPFDLIVMRLVDFGLSMPNLVAALAIIGVFGTGFWTMLAGLALVAWPAYARISRAVVISLMSQPHVEALVVLGARPSRVVFRHLIPATLGPVLVYASADAGAIAVSIATLSFLGLGVQPPTAEWGQMLVDGLRFLERSPREVMLPGLTLTLVVVAFNILGEALAVGKTPKPVGRRRLARLRAAMVQP